MRKYMRANPAYRIQRRFGTRIGEALKLNGLRKNRRAFDILGYSREELMRHLELQFTKGMDWSNYGEWHVDHIIPVTAFNLVDEASCARIWSLSNLRPLWAAENKSKGNKRIHLL